MLGCWFGLGTEGVGYYGQFEECANGSGGTGALIYFWVKFSKESQENGNSLSWQGMAKLQTWVAAKCHTLAWW